MAEQDDRPSFRRERQPITFGNYRLLITLLVGATLALLARDQWEPRADDGVLVEVAGDVPRPGTYLLEDPTVAEAVRAAGGEIEGVPDTPVPAGHRVVVAGDEVTVASPSDPLLVALPVDVNEATVDELTAIPGLGRPAAIAIVDERERAGPYAEVDALTRARGIGAAKVEELRPFVTVGEVAPAGPLDLNTATAAELERLPGIGAVTAARIVVDREDHGPYTRLEDLRRVRGVGDATIERLRDHVVVGTPAP